MEIPVPTAPAELIDKITILEIKADRIGDARKRANVRAELSLLHQARDAAIAPSDWLARLTAALRAVNEELWEIEDKIRECERRGDFGLVFVELARAVYRTNDRRAAIKREINTRLDSNIVEEKAYAAYS
ncbi:MAG: DUF6165 family protein [Alphaproteobacteria bacterium]